MKAGIEIQKPGFTILAKVFDQRRNKLIFYFYKEMFSTSGRKTGTSISAPKCTWVIRKPRQANQYSNCSQHLHCLLHLHEVSLHHGIKEETEAKEMAHSSRRCRAGRGLQPMSPGCSSFS